jgi:hypothetical protein
VRPIYRTSVLLPSKCWFYIFFSTNISTEYFKHVAHSTFFSSKCRLFHKATFFWFQYYSHFTYRILCFLVRATSFIPISTPTDATCDRSLFLSICIRLYMFRASSAHHQESLTVQDSAKDGNKHRNWRLHVQWGTPDDGRLTLETCRVVYI